MYILLFYYQVDPQASKVLVGFDAWDSRWDEWIPIDSNRLRERLTTDEAMHTSGTIESAPKVSCIGGSSSSYHHLL